LRPGGELDFTRGVLQNIGIKEMFPFIRAKYAHDTGANGDPRPGEQALANLHAECVEGMKRATRRYVRYAGDRLRPKARAWLFRDVVSFS
jgi:hypothetical protein